MYQLERHHIVFRSQGGIDFPLNFIYLTPEQHKGNEGPHLNRKRDLQLKKDMQVELRIKLTKDHYTMKEIIEILGLNKKQAEKAFKRINQVDGQLKKEDIIFRLMGNRNYL